LLAAARPGCFDAVVGDDADAAALLPVVIGELCTALQAVTSPAELRHEVANWLDEHRARLADVA
jgi:hypothetical protein